ncbi:hypothetical protein [Bradyrhizobium sp. CSA112]|uniref:ATP-dependent DNA ligase n=1 Tax=Bradyrhizobium sp. CSA112 TaxID=2699170 RepID=UPI0023B0E07A|nr:hypothetical protein [Bradyrhizobium sp. CSA112]
MAFQRRKPTAIGVKAPLPGFIELALATSVEKVPNADHWLHEIKFDGYRVQVHINSGRKKVYTRNGQTGLNDFRLLLALSIYRVKPSSMGK